MVETRKGDYVFNTKDKQISAEEMERLLDQSEMLDEVIPLLPAGFDPNNRRILDVACGPGGWALQVALQCPTTDVIGVDEDPQMLAYAEAQARTGDRPNAKFGRMNILQPFIFPDNSFDFVNVRLVGLVVPRDYCEMFAKECARVVKPGGVFRWTEAAGSEISGSPITNRVQSLFYHVAHKAGKSFSTNSYAWSPMLGKFLRKAGCSNIVETPYSFNISSGYPLHDSMTDNIKRSIHLLKKSGVISDVEDIDAMYQQACTEMDSEDFSAVVFMYSATGIKAS